MTCNSRCTHAKGDLCRCECEGTNHGIYADDEDLEENKEENNVKEDKLTDYNFPGCYGYEDEEVYGPQEEQIIIKKKLQTKITDFEEVSL